MVEAKDDTAEAKSGEVELAADVEVEVGAAELVAIVEVEC
jgi:hypothetical protein